MNKDPKGTGEKTEASILNHLIQKGISVSIPWGNNQRYDLIFEENGKLYRGQCKTGKFKDGVVMFSTASTSGSQKSTRKIYTGQIDCFLIYCHQINKFFKINITDAPHKSQMRLRIDPPKNLLNISTINWAKDYEI